MFKQLQLNTSGRGWVFTSCISSFDEPGNEAKAVSIVYLGGHTQESTLAKLSIEL